MKKTPEINKPDAFKSITRGGQTILHNLRMINQVLNKVLLWALPLWLLAFVVCFLSKSHAYDFYLGKQWLGAQIKLLWQSANAQQPFLQPDGEWVNASLQQIVNAPFMALALQRLKAVAIRSAWAALFLYGFAVGAILWWLKKRGEAQSAPRYVKGDYLDDVNAIRRLMKKKHKLASLLLGEAQLPIPAGAEMQHFLFHGTTGAGKSTAIKELLDYIRSRGDRAIIYDKSCNLVKQFFSEGEDYLLNGLDARGVCWNLWRECRDKADFENLAAAIIPMPPASPDPFWVNAARTIFAAAAYRMRDQENPKVVDLLRYLLTADIGELQSLLQGTEAETLMSEKTEKTAISIKSVLATYLKSLCYVSDGEQAFSIRQWVNDDYGSQWLFISSLGDKHEALKPLITCWLDIAVNALLSLAENRERRIWVILDELASLQQLPYLSSALSEARKFGGCFVVGVQAYAQLAKIYGEKGAQEISSLLNTRFIFRQPDPEMASWSAKNLGETTIEEVREGISYGANTMRDGVSVNRVEQKKLVVDISEIKRLPDLTCYVRVPGEYPIARLTFVPLKREERNAPFVARLYAQENLRRDMLQWVEKAASAEEAKEAGKVEKSGKSAKPATSHHASSPRNQDIGTAKKGMRKTAAKKQVEHASPPTNFAETEKTPEEIFS